MVTCNCCKTRVSKEKSREKDCLDLFWLPCLSDRRSAGLMILPLREEKKTLKSAGQGLSHSGQIKDLEILGKECLKIEHRIRHCYLKEAEKGLDWKPRAFRFHKEWYSSGDLVDDFSTPYSIFFYFETSFFMSLISLFVLSFLRAGGGLKRVTVLYNTWDIFPFKHFNIPPSPPRPKSLAPPPPLQFDALTTLVRVPHIK